jgi:dethiobiotin synthetase
LYCLKNPKAPAFAARDEGITIDPEKVLAFIDEKQAQHDPIILEAAGGLMVPVTDTHLVIDIVKAVDAHPVVAARAGLGTINHSLLTLSLLKREGFSNPVLFFIDKDNTDPAMIHENIEAIKRHSGFDVAGVIGPVTDFSKPGEHVMNVIRNAMENKGLGIC